MKTSVCRGLSGSLLVSLTMFRESGLTSEISENCDSDENVRLYEGLFRGSCQDVVMRFVVVDFAGYPLSMVSLISSHPMCTATFDENVSQHHFEMCIILKVGVWQHLCA